MTTIPAPDGRLSWLGVLGQPQLTAEGGPWWEPVDYQVTQVLPGTRWSAYADATLLGDAEDAEGAIALCEIHDAQRPGPDEDAGPQKAAS